MRRISILLLAFFVCFVLAASSQARPQWKHKIMTFDVPGAGAAAGEGTYANGINPAGEITGFYVDSNNVYHSFLRSRGGDITTFDPPGVGSGPWQGSGGWAINAEGVITGDFVDSNCVEHGFLRTPDGDFTTFEAPGAGNTPGTCTPMGYFQGTTPSNINAAGVTFGWDMDTNYVFHGFLRAPDGTFTIIDAPGAGTGAYQGTLAPTETALNPAGAVTGPYADASNATHGYLRAQNGTIITFDVPGASQGTMPWGINAASATTGQYNDANGVSHGFLRSPHGRFTTFDHPKAGTGSGQGTIPVFFLPAWAIGGAYLDAGNVWHGFVRDRNGYFSTFDAPGAGKSAGQGTGCGAFFSVNPAGEITTWSVDKNGVYHGVIRSTGDEQ